MSDEEADAVAELISADAVTFASLPLPLAQRIFLELPADERARACCVCRAWRDMLADTSLWTRLDMSFVRVLRPSGLFSEQDLFQFAVVDAAARAHGQLRLLDFSQPPVEPDELVFVERNLLLQVLRENAGSMRELHLYRVDATDYYTEFAPTVEEVLAAAPLLQVLTAEYVECTRADALRMLRAEPPFALLQMRCTLAVHIDTNDGMASFGPFSAVLSDAALQPALRHLYVQSADMAEPALMGALVDAVLARRLPQLSFMNCTPPAAAPLARLLLEGLPAVLDFRFSDGDVPLFDAAGAALVANALRARPMLTKLHLERADVCLDMRAAGILLGALVGHRSLRELWITMETPDDADRIVFGAALGALIAADALTAADVRALHELVCHSNNLGDAGLAPIVEALALNSHNLRKLDLHGNSMSEAFARERLLPAVRANTTLRALDCLGYGETEPAAAAEAEELVRRRGLHG
jgi:hypothetical protein